MTLTHKSSRLLPTLYPTDNFYFSGSVEDAGAPLLDSRGDHDPTFPKGVKAYNVWRL